ncbi:signal peptidase I [Georgenia sp. SYP-B2076]|uniref:signal peptidase I n=1 Tax=Georgenia sp. SYP-B2076 TaxID=2495881 RepID=UPI001F0C189E|nr:signal peptidase I [Georgenia sp. SYP-B2076]
MSTSSTGTPDSAPQDPGREGRAELGADAREAMPPTYPPSHEPASTAPARPPAASGNGRFRGTPDRLGGAPNHAGSEKAPRKGGWFRESVTVMVSALVLSILIKTFLAQAFYIPSGSMENTLAVGDRVMVNKLAPGPFDLERGDIVVFVDPGGWLGELPPDTRPQWQQTMSQVLTFVGLLPQNAGHHLIKRIIGVGGDTVACCDDQGRLTVNGTSIDEPYLKAGTSPSDVAFTAEVPEDHVWLMGDNRSNSEDSRAHLGDPGGGMVPVSNIVGRAFVVLWPAERIKLLNNPEATFAKVTDPPVKEPVP